MSFSAWMNSQKPKFAPWFTGVRSKIAQGWQRAIAGVWNWFRELLAALVHLLRKSIPILIIVVLVAFWMGFRATRKQAAGTGTQATAAKSREDRLRSLPLYPPSQAAVARVSVTPAPELSRFRVSVVSPPARWEFTDALFLDVHLANYGDDPITPSFVNGNQNSCVKIAPTKKFDALKPHTFDVQTLAIDVGGCSVLQRFAGIPLVVRYTWNEQLQPEKKPGGEQPKKFSASFEGIASTSPIIFERPEESASEWQIRLAHGIYTLLKELIWPLVLVLLGFILNIYLNRRTQILEDKQTRRAERQELLTNLLPEYLKRVQQHYLPIARRIATVEEEWQAIPKTASAIPAAMPPDPEKDAYIRTLSAIILMRRRVQYMALKQGGVFFRTSIGEELFDQCISEFFRNCWSHLDKDTFESAASGFKPEATVSHTIDVLFVSGVPVKAPVSTVAAPGLSAVSSISPPSKPVWELVQLNAFRKWADHGTTGCGTFAEYLNLLKLSRCILSFECDRTFYQTDPNANASPSGWYFDPPQLEITPDMFVLPAPADAAQDRIEKTESYSRAAIFSLMVKYLDGMPRRCLPEDAVQIKEWLNKQKNNLIAGRPIVPY